MTKRLLAVYLVLVVLIALLVPSCAGGGKCTIYVKATLCGNPWQGAVNYELTLAGGTSPISGTSVDAGHTVDCGTWTCAYVSGGPAGAFFVDITPSATQTVTGGNITFVLNFEKKQDAGIEFLSWTINGHFASNNTIQDPYPLPWCSIIDVEYLQRVDGCLGYNVTLNETAELMIINWGPVTQGMLFVRNDDCAVNKTPAQQPGVLPPTKLGQVTSFNGKRADHGEGYDFVLQTGQNWTLDVETSWQLVKCLNYTKTINWLHIGGCEPAPVCCALFEIQGYQPGTLLELRSHASVELVGAVDVNPQNSDTGWSPSLWIILM